MCFGPKNYFKLKRETIITDVYDALYFHDNLPHVLSHVEGSRVIYWWIKTSTYKL